MKNRRHPQTANAPEAKRCEYCRKRLHVLREFVHPKLSGVYHAPCIDKALAVQMKTADAYSMHFNGRPVTYGRGVPPGEPIRLTAAQLAAWRRDR